MAMPSIQITTEMVVTVYNAANFHAKTNKDIWAYFYHNDTWDFCYDWFNTSFMNKMDAKSAEELQEFKEVSEQNRLRYELYQACLLHKQGFLFPARQKAYQDALDGKNTLGYLDRYDDSIEKRKFEIDNNITHDAASIDELNSSELQSEIERLEAHLKELQQEGIGTPKFPGEEKANNG